MVLIPARLWAQWEENGGAVCTETGNQVSPLAVSDGWGGTVVVWVDSRSGSYDIYAQRTDRDGYALWTQDGIGICTNSEDQTSARLTQDGTGGTIIIWLDYRGGDPVVYAQRINGYGDELWASDGIPVCTTGSPHSLPWIIPDEAGGAIIVWGDDRAGGENTDIYAQRVDAGGNLLWSSAGMPICSASGNQYYQSIITDGAGGAIITWVDYRGGLIDIYAQRIDASGNPLWLTDGVAVCASDGPQWTPKLVSDGENGAVVGFDSSPTNFGETDIRAQRIDAEGDIRWAPDGVPICTAMGSQYLADMTNDGCGGVILIWRDDRNLWGSNDLYAQRVDMTGSVPWTADGVLCSSVAVSSPVLIPDGSCGAIISSRVFDEPGQAVIAQRIDSDGILLWPGNGTTVCSQSATGQLGLVTDGAGGGIVAWQDDRPGLEWREANYGLTNYDVRSIEIWFEYVFAGTFGGGVFRANEYEAKWSAVNNGLTNLNVQDVVPFVGIWAATQGGGVYHSLDYGGVWEQANNGLAHLDVHSLLFRSSDLGFAGTYGGGVYRTMDGGDSWAQANSGISHMDVNLMAYNHNNAQILAGTNGGGLYATADSGTTWVQLNNGLSNLDVRVFERKFPTDYVFVGTNGGGVFRSIDNGENWEECNTGLTNLNVRDIEIYTYLRHLLVGTDGGGVFISADNGDSWEPFNDGLTDMQVCDFTFKNLHNYYVATSGGGVFRYNVEYDIYANRVTADGDLVVTGSQSVQPAVTALHQNYPNPFNPTTTVRFDLQKPAHVKLIVYNVKGGLVSTVVDREMTEGCKEVTWSAKDNRGRAVSSGIYFYRLVAGDFVQTKKMVLLR